MFVVSNRGYEKVQAVAVCVGYDFVFDVKFNVMFLDEDGAYRVVTVFACDAFEDSLAVRFVGESVYVFCYESADSGRASEGSGSSSHVVRARFAHGDFATCDACLRTMKRCSPSTSYGTTMASTPFSLGLPSCCRSMRVPPGCLGRGVPSLLRG